MITEELTSLILVSGTGLVFFTIGLAGVQRGTMRGLRDTEIIEGDGEPSKSEGALAKIVGSILMLFGLFLIYIGLV